jgi:hypothetical protein
VFAEHFPAHLRVDHMVGAIGEVSADMHEVGHVRTRLAQHGHYIGPNLTQLILGLGWDGAIGDFRRLTADNQELVAGYDTVAINRRWERRRPWD